ALPRRRGPRRDGDVRGLGALPGDRRAGALRRGLLRLRRGRRVLRGRPRRGPTLDGGMAKTWVLETSTKGTGANIVPLDDEQDAPESPPVRERERLWVHKPTNPRPAPKPEPKRPRRFKVVEITTHRVLAEDADARATIA